MAATFSPHLSLSTLATSVASEDEAASPDEKSPTVRFTNVDELFQEIDRVSGDFLVVTNVSPQDFSQIDQERTGRRRKFRVRRYHTDMRILVITIPTRLHEQLHLSLYNQFRDQLVRQGREDSWEGIGTTTFRALGHPGGDGGEGDSTGGPWPERSGLDDWPTLVIEAGHSESLAELRRDMNWWFSISDHQVKIVLLVKFDYSRQTIIIERWEEEQRVARPGATTTRSAATLEPTSRQRIVITQNTATDPVSYNVTRGALVLSFRLLFLRDPGPLERDFVISIPELESYAARVWRFQDSSQS